MPGPSQRTTWMVLVTLGVVSGILTLLRPLLYDESGSSETLLSLLRGMAWDVSATTCASIMLAYLLSVAFSGARSTGLIAAFAMTVVSCAVLPVAPVHSGIVAIYWAPLAVWLLARWYDEGGLRWLVGAVIPILFALTIVPHAAGGALPVLFLWWKGWRRYGQRTKYIVIPVLVVAVSAIFTSVTYRWGGPSLESVVVVDGPTALSPFPGGVSRFLRYLYWTALALVVPIGWRMVRRERNLCSGVMLLAIGGVIVQGLVRTGNPLSNETAPFAAVLLAEVGCALWRRERWC
jgi:hypothetical protein